MSVGSIVGNGYSDLTAAAPGGSALALKKFSTKSVTISSRASGNDLTGGLEHGRRKLVSNVVPGVAAPHMFHRRRARGAAPGILIDHSQHQSG